MANPVGRPLKFKTPEELESKIQAYFDSCFEEIWVDEDARDENGNIIFEDTGINLGKVVKKHTKKKKQIKPFSITGLAVALDTSRETLLQYEGEVEGRDNRDQKFVDTIKRAKDLIHNYAEDGLLTGKINAAAGIFNLKNNWHWKDEVHTVTTPAGLSDEQKKKMDEILLGKKPEEKVATDINVATKPEEKSNETAQPNSTGTNTGGNEGTEKVSL